MFTYTRTTQHSMQAAEEAGRQTRALQQQHERLKAELRTRSSANERRHAPRRVQARGCYCF